MDQRTRKLGMTHKALHTSDTSDYMCQEKKKEEDAPKLKIVCIHQFGKLKTILKRAKDELLHQPFAAMVT